MTAKPKIPPNASALARAILAHMEAKRVSDEELDGMIEWARQLAAALAELKLKRTLSP